MKKLYLVFDSIKKTATLKKVTKACSITVYLYNRCSGLRASHNRAGKQAERNRNGA
jgi:hypothetical protein